jgi:isopentenyl-diphosphate Delta-isomerase
LIETRKAKHLTICTNPLQYSIEKGSAGFEGVNLVHQPLPEIDAQAIDTTLEFFGHRVNLPVFISCMTGGSEGGFEVNKNLARAAQILGIPVGLGSVRVLFDHEELIHHFHVKPLAPDVPVMANLGSVEVRDRSHTDILNLMERLEVQSLTVHLNPGQEMFQSEGDRDFTGLKFAIARLCEKSSIPIIVKETGFGIPVTTVHELLELGVSYVDLAGAGGTNWISVEAYRLPEEDRRPSREFEDWGLPTAYLMAGIARSPLRNSGKILASGGLRRGMDVAKSLVLGAEMAGMALPIVQKEREAGTDGVVEFFKDIESTLRTVMLLTGSSDLDSLRRKPYWFEADFARSFESFSTAHETAMDPVPAMLREKLTS